MKKKLAVMLAATLLASIALGISSSQPASAAPIIHMEDTTASTGQSIWSGRPVHAEYVSPSSSLVGKQIDAMIVKLKKAGSPTGNVEVGIFNSDLSVKKLFATKDVSTLTTSYLDYEFALSGGPYTVAAGDRIGVKYSGGTSTVNISIMRDTDPADPFDGSNSYHTYYTTSWSNFVANDLTMTLKLIGSAGPGDTTPPAVLVSHSPQNPSSSQAVTITATATDNVGLSSVEIFVDGSSIGSCPSSGTSDSCAKPAGTFAEGSSHTYYATAADGQGLVGSSTQGSFAISSSGTGTFNDQVFENGLNDPTSMAFTPDGRLFVAEKGGTLRVIKNGALLAAPFLSIPVSTSGERGLIGMAIDPNFAVNKYVYVQYTTSSDPIHNKVSRFTASTSNPDVAAAGSEVAIIDLDTLDGSFHNAGALHFGGDGKLYIAAGDNTHSSDAQKLTTRLGKILRINSDGTIPTDNPFYNTANAKKEIWALGLRNPFTFAFSNTGIMHINDVGKDLVEEVNKGTSGGNYGWPTCEGSCSNANFINPIYMYEHPAGEGRSIAGGAFYHGTQFPTEYQGDYFFGDYVGNFIKRLTAGNQVADFLEDTPTPVDIDVGPDGSLYYLSYQNGEVHRVQYEGSENGVPNAVAAASPTFGIPPLAVNFDASGSTDPDGDALAYLWDFGDNASGSGVTAAHTYSSAGQYVATLTVSDDNGSQDSSTVSITVGNPPDGAIDAPVAGTKYIAGDTISFGGSGTDTEDGTLPASAFHWEVLLHHNIHTHPFEIFDGIKSGTFTIPQQSETDHDVFYRIYLTVTDSTGLQHTSTRDLLPNKATITVDSNIPGLSINLDGQPHATPYSVLGVVGVARTLDAPLTQSSNGETYQFQSWSDGGATTHSIITPAVDTTYIANYTIGTGLAVHMQDTTASTGQNIWSGRPVHAEYVSPSSSLVGKQINAMTVTLKKSGTATGTAEIGVINQDLSMKKIFATLDVSTLTTSYKSYEFSSASLYTIAAGDRIGVKYSAGTSSVNISIMRDTDPADPFDGQNSYHTYYTTSWSSFVANDLTMTLKQN
ncbi:PQQ-dependent sugar dehydrogenase [Candidatus Nitrososphaera sp. FF02]|uniref:PQQ-dependent sugar dehydrogenase n=1 Tax=Candidatus Nitrososphaera sp. FF02 TaxID=3398226 RepID=UPI0039E88BE8